MSDIQLIGSVEELRSRARKRIPRLAFDYIDGGAESEGGLVRNRRALDDICLAPRYLVDVAKRDQTTRKREVMPCWRTGF